MAVAVLANDIDAIDTEFDVRNAQGGLVNDVLVMGFEVARVLSINHGQPNRGVPGRVHVVRGAHGTRCESHPRNMPLWFVHPLKAEPTTPERGKP